MGVESGHCLSSWLALLQDSWQWPGSPTGDSHHSLGPSLSPKEHGDPRPGIQGYSVLSSLVGPACIFLRPSIAATQLVCTAARPPPPRFASPYVGEQGLSGEARAKAHRSRGVRGRETQRNVRDSYPGDGQGGGRVPRRGTEKTRDSDFEDPRAKPEVLSNLRCTSGQ